MKRPNSEKRDSSAKRQPTFVNRNVAFHGSAPDQTPDEQDGYRVSRVHFADGRPVWMEDLVRGFTIGSGHWARPVGLLVERDGSVLISDDWGGRVFRLRYTGQTR